MQDFNYEFSNCMEITIEQSRCKYPSTNPRAQEWDLNKESVLSFLESANRGLAGQVLDVNGNPVEGAKVYVLGNTKPVTTTARGEFWKLVRA